MTIVIGFYLTLFLIFLAVAFASFQYVAWYRRARLRHRDLGTNAWAGFERTDEVSIDPTTGIKQRVWYNPETGERRYETLND